VKARASIMFKLHHLLEVHADELAALITQESGKNLTESLASVAKANETVEFACSLPQLVQVHTAGGHFRLATRPHVRRQLEL